MKLGQVFLIVILSTACAAGTAWFFRPVDEAHAIQETTYGRILRTGEIHCGYTSWDPLFYIDPKTNEKRGIFHDLMEEVGNRLGLKIIWQEEIGWGSLTESIKNRRVDMACAGYWLNAGRIKNVASSAPQIYSPLYVWVRENDRRGFKSLDDLNSDQLTVIHIDGSAESQVIGKRLPHVKTLSLPELNTSADEIQSLIAGKGDFIIADAATMKTYMDSNPGKVRSLFPDNPVDLFPNVMLMPPDDPRLKEVMDDTMRNIEYDGTLDAIIRKYGMGERLLRNPGPVRMAP